MEDEANPTSVRTRSNTLPDPKELRTLKNSVSSSEWNLRCDLALACRLLSIFDLDDLTFPSSSVRLNFSGFDQSVFLTNPVGILHDEITASSLVVVKEDGSSVSNSHFYIDHYAWELNAAVHSAKGARCVVRTNMIQFLLYRDLQGFGITNAKWRKSSQPESELNNSKFESFDLVVPEPSADIIAVPGQCLFICGESISETILRLIYLASNLRKRKAFHMVDGRPNFLSKIDKRNTSDAGQNHLQWAALKRRAEQKLPGWNI